MAHHAGAGIVGENPLHAERTLIGSVGDDLGTGVDRLADADTTTVMHRNPRGARCGVQQSVEDWPVGDRV